jgi:carbon monoxide dehydrogenase subunit G
MDLQDEIILAAPRDEVFARLIDPDILRDCIPGCQELTQVSDTQYEAKVSLKIGPVKANFKGDVTLDLSEAPARIGLAGKGNGGVAGFAKGGADVTLDDRGAETCLSYEAKAEVGGKLAQLGNRLVASTAKKLSKEFFECFAAKVS